MKKAFCDLCGNEVPMFSSEYRKQHLSSLRGSVGTTIGLRVEFLLGGNAGGGDLCDDCMAKVFENAAKKFRGEPLTDLGSGFKK